MKPEELVWITLDRPHSREELMELVAPGWQNSCPPGMLVKDQKGEVEILANYDVGFNTSGCGCCSSELKGPFVAYSLTVAELLEKL